MGVTNIGIGNIKEKVWRGTCETAHAVQAKVVNVGEGFELKEGVRIFIHFKKSNSVDNPTLNVNGTGAVEICNLNANNVLSGAWSADSYLYLTYVLYDSGTGILPTWLIDNYARGSADMLGSVRLSDAPDATLNTSRGIAVTPKALQAVKDYVDDTVADSKMQFYGDCETANAETEKIVTTSEDFVLKDGVAIDVFFNTYNSATSPTMNVNNTGAIPMKQFATTAVDPRLWRARSVVRFVYQADSNFWIMVNGARATTSYYGVTKLNDSLNSTSTTEAATAYAVKQAFDYADEAYTLADQTAPMCFNNVTVASTSGVSDNTYPDYPIRYDVTCNGLTTNYSADVRFGMTEVISGNFAPICDTATNIVKIFAKTAITADITIPTIVCTKVVYE